MPIWKEKVGRWIFVYLLSMLIVIFIPSDIYGYTLIVIGASLFIIKSNCVRSKLEGYNFILISAIAQILALALVTVGLLVNSMFFVLATVLMIGSALLTYLGEKHITIAIPQYGAESIILTLYSMLLLFGINFNIGQSFGKVLVAHLALLTIALMRNTRLIFTHANSQTANGTLIAKVDVRFCDIKGMQAIINSFGLPSGYIGGIMIVIDIIIIIVVGLKTHPFDLRQFILPMQSAIRANRQLDTVDTGRLSGEWAKISVPRRRGSPQEDVEVFR